MAAAETKETMHYDTDQEARRGRETAGILGGYEGLLEPLSYRELDYRDLGGLLNCGGTVLGTSSRARSASASGTEGGTRTT